MKFDKLTIKSQEAVAEAQAHASSRGHTAIEPAHLLRALLAQPEGSTVPVLQKLGVPIEPLQQRIEEQLARIPKVSGGAQPQLSSAISRVFDAAFATADKLKDEYVSTEHLLLAIAEDDKGPAGDALRAAGASPEAILQALAAVLTSYSIDSDGPPVASDINALASILEPKYTRRLKRNDPWGTEYDFSCDGTSFRIASAGVDETWGTEDDIVNEDGTMTQIPKGFRKL
jgi:ATP-dependent Clp protease ATP-binding subunit ClpA